MLASLFSSFRRFWFVAIWLLLPLAASAQTVTISACSGNLERCVTEADSLYEMCIEVKPGACAFASFDLDWGDGTKERIVQAGPLQRRHRYDLRTFIKNCEDGGSKRYTLSVITNCPGDNNANFLTFKIKPRAQFSTGDACEGRTLSFSNRTCPNTSDMTWLWDFGDGTTSTSASPSKVVSASVTAYTVKLTATNSCSSSTFQQVIPVLKTPVAKYNYSGYTVNPVNVTDTVVCLAGGGRLTMDATVSLDAKQYSWQISPSTYTFINGTSASSDKPQIQFSRSGTYTITLVARNDCGTSRPMVCTHKVIDGTSVSLTPEPDRCQPFQYKVANPTAGAVYSINGVPFDPNVPQSLSLSATPYIVTATLNGACGPLAAKPDTFLVAAAQPVKIMAPARGAVLCAGSGRVPLTADLSGGTWTVSGGGTLPQQNGQYFFDPQTPGRYLLTYQRGTAPCREQDTLTVTVQGVSVTARDQTACAGQTTVTLDATPGGGVWTTAACSNCITGNVLTLTGLTISQIPVSYSVANAAGCGARATATVTIGRPKAAFTITGTCSASGVTLQNNSTGATAYQWFVNGQLAASTAQPTLSLGTGTFVVKLRAGSGACADSTQQTVTLIAAPAAPSIIATNASGCSPLTVTFSAQNQPEPGVTYGWDFGDGTTENTYQPAPHTFRNSSSQTKTFSVRLTARNGCGTQVYPTEVTVRPLVKADLGVDSTTFRCSPARVKFSNRSLGQGQPAVWDFGNGQTLTSTADTLSRLFSARDSALTYRIILTVGNACGTDRDTVTIRILPISVRALFTISQARPCPGESVTFTDASTPRPDRWVWNFGDGTLANNAKPSHAFALPNTTYTISLTALTACGYDSVKHTIRTGALPTGDFQVKNPTVCQQQAICFTNVSDPRYRFRWGFGDGSPIDSVTFSPCHVFSSAGDKVVSLTVVGSSAACIYVVSKTVTVRTKPVPGFRLDSLASGYFCADTPIQLTNTSQNATEFWWYVGTNPPLMAQQPALTLPEGLYDLKLVAIGNGVCRDSLVQRGVIRVEKCGVYAPGAFSPNSDGRSDSWTLFGDVGTGQISLLRIRDQWGEVVFEMRNKPIGSTRPGEAWDGFIGDRQAPAGVYTYEAEVENRTGRPLRQVGQLLLAR